MKKKVLICASILLISALSFSFFTACDKDTDSHLEVTVYDVTGKILQPNAYVRAFTDNGTVELTGFTEGDGVFKPTLQHLAYSTYMLSKSSPIRHGMPRDTTATLMETRRYV